MKRFVSVLHALVVVTLVAATSACSAEADNEENSSSTVASPEEFDYQAHIEQLNIASGLTNPPKTELVRVVAPDDYGTVWKVCMQEAGQDLTVTPDGGVGPSENLPEEQQEAWEIAFYICVAQYPVDQSLFKQYGAEQIDLLYGYYVDTLVPCLEAEGFQQDEIPSLEAYRSGWLITESGVEQSGAAWVPYDAVPVSTLTPAEFESLDLNCPQAPTDEYLFPED